MKKNTEMTPTHPSKVEPSRRKIQRRPDNKGREKLLIVAGLVATFVAPTLPPYVTPYVMIPALVFLLGHAYVGKRVHDSIFIQLLFSVTLAGLTIPSIYLSQHPPLLSR